MKLKNKVALITGAGSGIGKASALLLTREGARVGALDLNEDELQQTVIEIESTGAEAIAVVADDSQPDEMPRAAEKIAGKWNRLDIVFANAGVNGVWTSLEELSPEEWDKTLNVNLKGTFLTVKYDLPFLKKQGGSIIVTSSVNGTRIFSNTGATAYASSKAAQVAFTKMVALEVAKHRIRANVICPGAIETSNEETAERRDLKVIREPVEFPEGKVPLTGGNPATADRVAELVLFLASDEGELYHRFRSLD